MSIPDFVWHAEKKTTAQTLINLYIIPRLHKEGYFVGIVPQCLCFEDISKKYSYALFDEWARRVDKEIMGLLTPSKTS